MKREKQVQTGLRIKPSLRDRIEAAALASGNSFNGEMIDRLERSFGVPPNLGNITDPRMLGIVAMLIDVMGAASEQTLWFKRKSESESKEWLDDPLARRAAVKAASYALSLLSTSEIESDFGPIDEPDEEARAAHIKFMREAWRGAAMQSLLMISAVPTLPDGREHPDTERRAIGDLLGRDLANQMWKSLLRSMGVEK